MGAVNHESSTRASDTARPWQVEYPYGWSRDDLASRRAMLRFAVAASGALFATTAVLAWLGRTLRLRRAERRKVARAADVAAGSAVYFAYPGRDDQAMLLRLPDGQFVAYGQKCTHLSCAVYYQPDRGRIFCPCHDGVFDPATGRPVAGPPRRRLAQVLLEREGETIYAVGRVP